MLNKKIHTKWGSAILNADGYYKISTSKEGFRSKYLHKIIFESFYKFKVPKGFVVHHKDGNKLNNCILNLQLMRTTEHLSLHNKGKIISDEHKQKISKSNKGNKYTLGYKHSKETRQRMSKSKKGNKNRLGKFHTEESKQKMREAHKGQQVRAKYTLWDISKTVYDKKVMYRNNSDGLFPKSCFRATYNKYRLPIGCNLDFLTCEIISDLINEEVG